MNGSKLHVHNINHFSGYKSHVQHYKSENAWVSIAYDYMNKDVSFDLFDRNLSKGSCSLKIVALLQEAGKFGTYMIDDSKLNEAKDCSHNQEENQHFLILFPQLEKLPENTEFIFPLLHSSLSLVYKSSSEEKDLYLRNLQSDVWFYLAITLALVTLCFRLSVFIHHRFEPKHSDWTWPETVQLILGAVCQQGSAREPQGNSCRTMFLMGSFITYMIFTAFAAGITSLLAITSDQPETPWEKALREDVTYVALCDSDGHRYLLELIPLVEVNGWRAVLSEGNLRRYLASCLREELRCDMSVSKQISPSYAQGFAVKQGSNLKHSINYWLLRMKEHGLLQREWDMCVPRVPVCHMSPGYTQVGLNHVKTAFIVMELSKVAALVIFLCELVWNRRAKTSDKHFKRRNPHPSNFLVPVNKSVPGLRRLSTTFRRDY